MRADYHVLNFVLKTKVTGDTGEMGGFPKAQYKGVERQQLGAILRMIGIENGYYDPSNWQQAMRIDWIVDTWGDAVTKVGSIFLGSRKASEYEAMCTGIFRKFMT